jgi:crotonobetainyl-CoA:carnitine CoA-transferase CaiB-like acyl-CoA transferase
MSDELAGESLPPESLSAPYGSWQTRDGRLLAVVDMTTAHLRDAIRLFERFGWGDHGKIRELREELARRVVRRIVRRIVP